MLFARSCVLFDCALPGISQGSLRDLSGISGLFPGSLRDLSGARAACLAALARRLAPHGCASEGPPTGRLLGVCTRLEGVSRLNARWHDRLDLLPVRIRELQGFAGLHSRGDREREQRCGFRSGKADAERVASRESRRHLHVKRAAVGPLRLYRRAWRCAHRHRHLSEMAAG